MKTVIEENAFEAIPGTSVFWLVSDDETHAEVFSRQAYPLRLKLNPAWWFQNLAEPDPPEWYKPSEKTWWRYVAWYCRNPLHNMGRYVVGVCDRNYSIIGTAPVRATTFSDANLDRIGWKWSVIRLGWMRLPFVAYENSRITFYIGWQWWGFFGVKLVLNKTPTIF